MTTQLRTSIVAAAALLALGVGGGLWSVGTALEARSAEGITATGSASIHATADTAAWSLYISKQDSSVKSAVTGILASLKRVEAFLKNGGIPEDGITVGGISTSPVYGADGPTGYFEASLEVRVRSEEPETVAALNRQMDKLFSASGDLTVSAGSPEYYVSNLDELRPQVQELAVLDAKNRADVMIKALDGSLGSIISVKAGSVTVTPPDVIEGEFGGYDLSTIDKSIRAVVYVEFRVG